MILNSGFKFFMAALLAALLLFAGWWWLGHDRGPAAVGGARQKAAVAVEVVAVRAMELSDVRSLNGSLKANAEFEVATRVGGRVKTVEVQIGDEVRRGQVIARLDDDAAVQQRAQARAELNVAEASVEEAQSAQELARAEYARISRLHRQGISAEAELERAQAEQAAARARLKLAQAQVAQRQALLRAAEIQLGYTLVRADWSGGGDTRLVGQRFVDPGATLAVNTAIISVLDLEPVIAVISVGEHDYVRLRPGQNAVVTAAAFGKLEFPATVARIAPRLDEDSRQARVELAVSNAEHWLKPGMFVQAQIVLASVAAPVVVPQAALAQRDGQTGVFQVEAGVDSADGDTGRAVAHFTPVTTGIVDGEWVQILEPELEGRVVTLGQHLLREGEIVRIAQPPPLVENDEQQ
jgi:RND family efflux transporter MFP subunit